MPDSNRAFLLGTLLKRVSRSFYLTLRVLPAGMRDPVGLAYLLARAADTIADTSLIAPAQRLDLLLALRAQVNGDRDDGTLARRLATEVAGQQSVTDEKVLLESLSPALDILAQLDDADRAAVRGIVTTLSEGMEFDLRTFPDEQSGRIVALDRPEALDRYTYLVAGCVGEFWTQMTYAHVPRALKGDPAAIVERGIRFGKALQMTNVLRDCAKDLRISRCYLPSSVLERHGLHPDDLLQPDASVRARPVLDELLRTTLGLYRDALAYTLSLPGHAIRLRLACIWPIMIGLETLVLLAGNDTWLDPRHASKIKRNDVYRILGYSFVAVASDCLVTRWANRLIDAVGARLVR
ncbi:phytoene/squalene synthase family protein [Pararobbsia silviterrae]|uniref:Squalene/phytoene synthase family protein n=1 Tax=Pararobbsia silviterrae TaxID=1792498 RepID=A0A494XM97_9BURK|nr:phytoene/squalene synthase family protein [Pararobbsia silviterrae]RKP51810.1 squalene/phytoene synthase family protein [Pararobbsia silviterrae]